MKQVLYLVFVAGLLLTLFPAAPPTPASANSPRPALPDTPTQPVPQVGASLEPGGFIQVSGDKLTRLGQEVRIKGVNYYPMGRPWTEMWAKWDGVQMQQELTLARDRLGINVIRILVPYDYPDDWHVDETLLTRMNQILQIAGDLDMRVIVTLFDFDNSFSRTDENSWKWHKRYIERLVGNYVGDDRILAWDLHNEPDHYPKWEEGNAPAVLDWLGRVADHVRSVDPNHLITVGMGQYQNFYQPGPDGRRVIDYVDFLSVHNYNAPDMERQLTDLRNYTDKPLVIGEFGWPTGPGCTNPLFNEAQQAEVYRTILQAAEGRAAGVIAWTLRDYHAGPTRRWDTREEYYGLFRFDNTLKPAAETFAAYAASPLPAWRDTDYTLASREPDEHESVQLIPQTGYYVKRNMLQAWSLLGGEGSFGLPISEAYEREHDGKIVQHFTAATLVYDPKVSQGFGFKELPELVQVMRSVQPADIGNVYTIGRTFPPQPPVPAGVPAEYDERTGYAIQGQFLDFYFYFQGEWRLGAPISPEVVEDVNGVSITRQYFERGVLEYNPQYNIVQFGQIGVPLWEAQCIANNL